MMHLVSRTRRNSETVFATVSNVIDIIIRIFKCTTTGFRSMLTKIWTLILVHWRTLPAPQSFLVLQHVSRNDRRNPLPTCMMKRGQVGETSQCQTLKDPFTQDPMWMNWMLKQVRLRGSIYHYGVLSAISSIMNGGWIHRDSQSIVSPSWPNMVHVILGSVRRQVGERRSKSCTITSR